MGAVKKVKLETSGKVVSFDLSKITISEFRIAVDKESNIKESDEVLAKACGLKVKDLQALAYTDYQQLVGAWWTSAMDPLDDKKKIVLNADQLEDFGVKYGDVVEIKRPDEPELPNSQSASTSE